MSKNLGFKGSYPTATQYLGYENKQEQMDYQPEILGLKLVCKTR